MTSLGGLTINNNAVSAATLTAKQVYSVVLESVSPVAHMGAVQPQIQFVYLPLSRVKV